MIKLPRQRIEIEAPVLFSFLIRESQFGHSLALRLSEENARLLRETESKLLADAKDSLKAKKRAASIVKENTTKEGEPDGLKLVISIKDIEGIQLRDRLAQPLTADPFGGAIVKVVLNLGVYELMSGTAGVKVYLQGMQVIKQAEVKTKELFKPVEENGDVAF